MAATVKKPASNAMGEELLNHSPSKSIESLALSVTVEKVDVQVDATTKVTKSGKLTNYTTQKNNTMNDIEKIIDMVDKSPIHEWKYIKLTTTYENVSCGVAITHVVLGSMNTNWIIRKYPYTEHSKCIIMQHGDDEYAMADGVFCKLVCRYKKHNDNLVAKSILEG